MTNYVQVLAVRFSGKHYSISGNDYESIVWESDTPKPTQEELDALWESVQIHIHNERMESMRKDAYISISDPLFFKWQRGEATQQEWLDAVEKIKLDYPYGG